MNKYLSLSILFFIVLSSINSYSQNPPIQWEEIPISDLRMSTYSPDTNASAIILCDYGFSKVNDEMGVDYERHTRIKILSEKGYSKGTQSIYLNTGNGGQRLDDLEAITYSLDANDEIITTELDDDEIFEEEVTENRMKITFTMPALKPGCIIDIKYKIIAESVGYMKGWYFQDDEPTIWSEYRMIYPKKISFAIVKLGYEPWEIDEYNEITQVYTGTASAYLGKIANCNSYRWAVKNAPALRDEPYITTLRDYINEIDVQLSGYVSGTTVKKVLNDWPTLCEELIDDSDFGDKIDPGEVEELTAEITKGLQSSEEKLNAIYNWVSRSIVWDEVYTIFAYDDLDEVVEYKKGSIAELTFLLISMLKSTGIEAQPVILSTRAHGAIQEYYPILSQFNYVIARAKIGSNIYYLDVSDPRRPMHLLPERILNVRGLVVNSDKPEWVRISTDEPNTNKCLVNLNLKTDGSIEVNFEDQFGDYTSLHIREDFGDKQNLDIAKDIYDFESLGFILDSLNIVCKDSIDQPLKIQASISSSDYSQVGGDLIYLNPCILHRLKENPFKVSQRKFPIDYSYPRSEIMVINVYLPDGYEIKEVYSNKSLSAGSYTSFKRQVQVQENMIQILMKMDIKDSIISSKFYERLKDYYTEIISAESEMLVIGPMMNSEMGSMENK